MRLAPGARGPTLRSELRRGLGAYNLAVALVPGVAAGLASLGLFPPLTAAGMGTLVFASVTLLHTAAHAWFGWKLGRGVEAHRAGRHEDAVSRLAVLERRGVGHYDPEGVAARALASSRAALLAAGGVDAQ